MKLHHGHAQQSTNSNLDPVRGGRVQGDLFSNLDPRYKVERKLGEEGNITNSLSMLTTIPEVNLDMEYALLSFSI